MPSTVHPFLPHHPVGVPQGRTRWRNTSSRSTPLGFFHKWGEGARRHIGFFCKMNISFCIIRPTIDFTHFLEAAMVIIIIAMSAKYEST